VNLPNSITLARILSVPLFLWILTGSQFSTPHGRQELLAAIIFAIASATDGIDGVLARHLKQVTTLGTLLSPLADKLLVSTAFITLVSFAPELVPGWIAVLIVGREFLVTGLQSVALQEKLALRVFGIGKLKTVVQTLSVAAVLMAHAWPRWHIGGSTLPGATIATISIWLMLAVSLISASAYFGAFWNEAVRQYELRHRRAPLVVKRGGDQNVSTR
jgi:CDP-diacylglycerol--glycerol-3-phosphate 3-phosphatidyltransferase